MTTIAYNVATAVVPVSFWGAVIIFSTSAFLALLKVFAMDRYSGLCPELDRALPMLARGYIGAVALVFLPSFATLAGTATDTAEASAPHRLTVMEYVRGLPYYAIWVVIATHILWLFALASTLVALYLRSRRLRRGREEKWMSDMRQQLAYEPTQVMQQLAYEPTQVMQQLAETPRQMAQPVTPQEPEE